MSENEKKEAEDLNAKAEEQKDAKGQMACTAMSSDVCGIGSYATHDISCGGQSHSVCGIRRSW